MTKFSALLLSVLTSIIFWGCQAVVVEEPAVPIAILPDAITSASGEIRIDSGMVYDTFAILHTYHLDSYTDVWIGYGLTPDSGNVEYESKVEVVAFPWNQACTLRALQPNTEYFLYFSAGFDDPEKYEKEHHGAFGSFTTTRLSDEF